MEAGVHATGHGHSKPPREAQPKRDDVGRDGRRGPSSLPVSRGQVRSQARHQARRREVEQGLESIKSHTHEQFHQLSEEVDIRISSACDSMRNEISKLRQDIVGDIQKLVVEQAAHAPHRERVSEAAQVPTTPAPLAVEMAPCTPPSKPPKRRWNMRQSVDQGNVLPKSTSLPLPEPFSSGRGGATARSGRFAGEKLPIELDSSLRANDEAASVIAAKGVEHLRSPQGTSIPVFHFDIDTLVQEVEPFCPLLFGELDEPGLLAKIDIANFAVVARVFADLGLCEAQEETSNARPKTGSSIPVFPFDIDLLVQEVEPFCPLLFGELDEPGLLAKDDIANFAVVARVFADLGLCEAHEQTSNARPKTGTSIPVFPFDIDLLVQEVDPFCPLLFGELDEPGLLAKDDIKNFAVVARTFAELGLLEERGNLDTNGFLPTVCLGGTPSKKLSGSAARSVQRPLDMPASRENHWEQSPRKGARTPHIPHGVSDQVLAGRPGSSASSSQQAPVDGTSTVCTNCKFHFKFYEDDCFSCPCGGVLCMECVQKQQCRRCLGRGSDGRYKTALCRNFERGACEYGHACSFAHGQHDIRSKRTGVGGSQMQKGVDSHCKSPISLSGSSSCDSCDWFAGCSGDEGPGFDEFDGW